MVLDVTPPKLVDLHLTAHHTILTHASSTEEIWIPHSLLLSIQLFSTTRDAQARTPLTIRTRDFESRTLLFSKKQDAKAVYESLEAVVAKRGKLPSCLAPVLSGCKEILRTDLQYRVAVSTEQLYAFCEPPSPQASTSKNGWKIYDVESEFARMGVFDSPTAKARTSAWRLTTVNQAYEYCPTYPAQLVVPSKISDATLNYGKSYRSKFRIPSLVYLHWSNLGSITRASQPMVGLKNARSIQDEKLIEAVFNSHSYHHSANMSNVSYISHSPGAVFGATPTNIIIDARPTTNAMANVAKGAGTENMEYYRNCRKAYLGIDNIHVMRDSLNRIIEAVRTPDLNRDLLRRSNWLKHLSNILEGIVIIVRAIHLANSHVLIHCSDGWDRTSQLSAVSQLCLDPYYRTMEGFAVLVEKDWVSFGHHFEARYGHTCPQRVQCVYTGGEEEDEEVGFLASMQQRLTFSGQSHGFKETSPVFDQFLDTVHQLQYQFPTAFEFNDLFLLELQKQLYECKYGNFLYNSEKERVEARVEEQTQSIWPALLSDPKYRNSAWEKDIKAGDEVIFPDPKNVRWWTSWFKREDMNDTPVIVPAEPTFVDSIADDPVLNSKVLPLSSSATLPPDAGSAKESRGFSNGAEPLESAAVSQASTAVQGAMRSAWSAWKSVKQGYDGYVNQPNEQSQQQPQRERPLSIWQASPDPWASPRPASTPPRSATPTHSPQKPTLSTETEAPSMRYKAEVEDNPWNRSSNGSTGTANAGSNGTSSKDVDNSDPLGVKVWT